MTDFSVVRQQAGLTIAQVAELTGYTKRTVYRWEQGKTQPKKAVFELIKSQKLLPVPQQSKFDFIDLFAGIGGMRLGFETIGGRCVFTSEWDKFAQKTYRANFVDGCEIAGDITKIDASDIPAHDVLLAGFPCQPFSIAGVSKKNALKRPHGFLDDTQGTLFFDLARIIEHHRPKAFLLENVKNLVNHDKGNTFKVIYRVLTQELGYQVHWKVIDARAWVPQHRERIIIVGFRDQNQFSFEDFEVPNPLYGPKLKSVLHGEEGSEKSEKPYTQGSEARVNEKYTLSDHLWTYLQDYAQKHRQKGNGFGFGLVGREDVSRTLSARYFKDGSEILVRQQGKNPRRLTPRECARLMGFDTQAKSPFVIPVSDTQAYKQFGNAVVVPVIEAVAQYMRPWIVQSVEQLRLIQSISVTDDNNAPIVSSKAKKLLHATG